MALTPEEAAELAALEAEFATPPPQSGLSEPEAAELAALEAELGGTPAPQQQGGEEYSPSWNDRLNAVAQGLSFGFSDELGNIPAAAYDAITSDDSFIDSWTKRMQGSQDARHRYADAAPVENLALNVAGGVASAPATLAKTFVNATRTLPRALQHLGAAGAEGAVAGYGSADMGERGGGATTGAVLGTGLRGVLGGAGAAGKKILDTVSARNIAEDLNGRPINIVDPEHALGRFYRDTVGEAYGGGRILDQTLDAEKKALKAVADNTASVNAKAFKAAMPDTADAPKLLKLAGSNPKKAATELKRQWNKKAFSSVKGRDFRVDDAELSNDIMDAVEDPAMRGYAGELLDAINAKLSPNMKRDMIPPPKGQAFRTTPSGTVEPVPPTPSSSGTISGDELMEARNSFRRMANQKGDGAEARLSRAAYAKAASKIDKIIKSQLKNDPEALASFNRELQKYGNYTVLRKAMAKGRKKGEDQFTPEQLMASIPAGGQIVDRVGAGTAPMQRIAEKGLNEGKALTQTVKNIQRAKPPGRTGVNKLAQTAMLGSPVMAAVPLAAAPLAIPAGMASAKVLSSEGGQKLMAGQTGGQAKIAEALRQYEGGPLQDILGRVSTGTRRGIITEQD